MKKPTTSARLDEMQEQLCGLHASIDALEAELSVTKDFVYVQGALLAPLLDMIPPDRFGEVLQYWHLSRALFANSSVGDQDGAALQHLHEQIERLELVAQLLEGS